MTARRLSMLAAAAVVLAPAVAACARGDPPGSGHVPAGNSSSPGRRLAEMVRRLDANHNGLLEAGEIPARLQSLIDRVAGGAGLDRSRALSLDKLAGAFERRFQQPSGHGAPTSASTPPPGPPDARYLRYANLLMKKYDANRDGVLQQDEWSAMPGNPGATDRNGDGRVTVQELAGRLGSPRERPSGAAPAAMAARPAEASSVAKRPAPSGFRSSPSPAPPRGHVQRPERMPAPPRHFSSSSRVVKLSGGGGTREAVRPVHVPPKRLPAGLPDWYSEKDADGDGQIMMHEYAHAWSEAKVVEFRKYDLNDDGVITPKECRRAELEDGKAAPK